jgi:predicted RNA-binding Zn ribbon-like protein
MTTDLQTPKFQFVGGALCLDFCNTVGGSREGIARERLNSIRDFVAWSEQAGLIDHAEAEGLLRAEGDNRASSEALSRAVALREAIYRIFRSSSKGKTPDQADLARLNAELEASLGRLRVEKPKGEKGFRWQWGEDELRLENPLGPIARSAAELLTHDDALKQVGQCHGHNCGWLFVDLSKNHSRRWCDMRDCGNRAKVRRFRAKH